MSRLLDTSLFLRGECTLVQFWTVLSSRDACNMHTVLWCDVNPMYIISTLVCFPFPASSCCLVPCSSSRENDIGTYPSRTVYLRVCYSWHVWYMFFGYRLLSRRDCYEAGCRRYKFRTPSGRHNKTAQLENSNSSKTRDSIFVEGICKPSSPHRVSMDPWLFEISKSEPTVQRFQGISDPELATQWRLSV